MSELVSAGIIAARMKAARVRKEEAAAEAAREKREQYERNKKTAIDKTLPLVLNLIANRINAEMESDSSRFNQVLPDWTLPHLLYDSIVEALRDKGYIATIDVVRHRDQEDCEIRDPDYRLDVRWGHLLND